MLERFRRAVSRVFDQNVYSTRLRAFYSPLLGFLPSLGLAVVLLVGGREVINGTLSLGDFTAFYTYLVMLIGPMRMLGTALGMAQRAVASGNRLFEILDREPRIESPPDAPPLPAGPGRVELRGRRRSRYDGDEPALDGRRPRGRGRHGRSRSSARPGRARRASSRCSRASTTRPRARSRSTAPTCARSTSARCARQVAFVADDSFLFSATRRREHRLRPPRRDPRGDRARRAARAGARRSSSACPTATRRVVGERGLTLSGGQRQRIAIARALLADPRILILDDATSSVDAQTEAAIKRGLREAMAGRTTFIVAHRLSTISLADEIVVMDGGPDRRPRHPRGAARALPALRARSPSTACEDAVFLQRDLEEREEVARL